MEQNVVFSQGQLVRATAIPISGTSSTKVLIEFYVPVGWTYDETKALISTSKKLTKHAQRSHRRNVKIENLDPDMATHITPYRLLALIVYTRGHVNPWPCMICQNPHERLFEKCVSMDGVRGNACAAHIWGNHGVYCDHHKQKGVIATQASSGNSDARQKKMLNAARYAVAMTTGLAMVPEDAFNSADLIRRVVGSHPQEDVLTGSQIIWPDFVAPNPRRGLQADQATLNDNGHVVGRFEMTGQLITPNEPDQELHASEEELFFQDMEPLGTPFEINANDTFFTTILLTPENVEEAQRLIANRVRVVLGGTAIRPQRLEAVEQFAQRLANARLQYCRWQTIHNYYKEGTHNRKNYWKAPQPGFEELDLLEEFGPWLRNRRI